MQQGGRGAVLGGCTGWRKAYLARAKEAQRLVLVRADYFFRNLCVGKKMWLRATWCSKRKILLTFRYGSFASSFGLKMWKRG
jgi:hypothetical protein